MTARAVILDAEFLAVPDSHTRLWCGPQDPDPLCVQIGAVMLDLTPPFDLGQTFATHVAPTDRAGNPAMPDPFLTRLTGVTPEDVAAAPPIDQALDRLDTFADSARIWSWGKDELWMVAVSCYIAGTAPPIPPDRFGNAAALILKAGIPPETLATTRSNELAPRYVPDAPPLREHDALDDARSVALTLQHFLRTDRITAADFTA